MKRVYRNQNVWLELIKECRASSLSDAEWCRQNGINISTFYATVKKFKKAGVRIPAKASRGINDLSVENRETAHEEPKTDETPKSISFNGIGIMNGAEASDKSCAIEIEMGDIKVRVNNGTDPKLLAEMMSVLGKV